MKSVGIAEGLLFDPARPAWRDSGPRPVAWSSWYPADPKTGALEAARQAAEPAVFQSLGGRRNADLDTAKARWPIVLLSHGTGGQAQGLDWLGHRLAGGGYVCIGVSHHGNTGIEPYLPEGFLCWWERARDLTVALDQLSVTGIFDGRLDTANVCVAGFSLGAYTVLALAGARTSLERFDAWLASNPGMAGGPREFPRLDKEIDGLRRTSTRFRQSWSRASDDYKDPRVRAAIALAPAPPVRSFDPDSLSSIRLPVGLMVGQDDREAPHDQCALWLKSQNPAFELSLLGDSVGHYVFLNSATDHGRSVAPVLCRDAPGVDRSAIHDAAALFATSVFQTATSKAR